MNSTGLRILSALRSGDKEIREISETLGVSYTRTTEIVKHLIEEGFLKRTDGSIASADTLHAVLYRRLADRYDMGKLLADSREDIATAILFADDFSEIQRRTGLSYWTVKRGLSAIMETGAVREHEKKYSLIEDPDLRLFLRSLNESREKRRVEPYADVIYSSVDTVLKKIPHGKPAKGVLTAFSAFWRFGVEIHPVQDYYIQRDKDPSIEEVLVHALIASTSPVEMTDCAVLLAKNLDRINRGEARSTAGRFDVESLLLDLENYVRGLTVAHPDRFLPWREYEEKARLYDVEPGSLLPREAYPDFFRLLGEQLPAPIDLYLFGGEAMRIRGLKRATKDIDVALEDADAFRRLEETLRRLGYTPLGGEPSEADKRLEASVIYVSGSYPRVDVFVKRICGAFTLSENMKRRTEHREMSNLRLHIISNEDLFLLKSITERGGDIIDMTILAKAPGFDWKTVYAELVYQEENTNRNYSRDLLEAIELVEQTGVKSPIHDRLVNRSLDQAIVEVIDVKGSASIREVRDLVNYPDYRIRSRVTRLVKEGILAAGGNGSYRKAP